MPGDDHKKEESILGKDLTTVSYVPNDDGEHRLVSGSTWQPVDIANKQAWQEIEKQINLSKKQIASGRFSCLHYYMTANQMDARLLAQYAGLATWKVRLHLRPFFFKRLDTNILQRYADVFCIELNDLIEGKLKPAIYNQKDNEVQS